MNPSDNPLRSQIIEGGSDASEDSHLEKEPCIKFPNDINPQFPK
jgi:hypothetical protein